MAYKGQKRRLNLGVREGRNQVMALIGILGMALI